MNRTTGITTALAALLLIFAASTSHATLEGSAKKGGQTDTISVPDMQCDMCESRIEKAVKGLSGISSVKASADDKRVIVSYNPKTISRSSIEEAIAAAGYDAGSVKTTTTAQAKLSACCRPSGHHE